MIFSKVHYILSKGNYPFYIKAPVLILSSWIFQGILYMDKTEKIFKLSLDIIFTFIFVAFGINVLTSILIAHTLNWIFNGQIFVTCKNLKIIKTPKEKFENYIERLKNRAKDEPSIIWVGVYGSLVRGEFKETSDLDVRIIRKAGIINGLRACIFVMRERTWATFNRFPLDIYVGDSFKFLEKMNEHCITLHK